MYRPLPTPARDGNKRPGLCARKAASPTSGARLNAKLTGRRRRSRLAGMELPRDLPPDASRWPAIVQALDGGARAELGAWLVRKWSEGRFEAAPRQE